MNTDIQVGSKIRVIDKNSPFFRWRGSVSTETLVSEKVEGKPKPDVSSFECTVKSASGEKAIESFRPDQLICIQKKFIDIEQLREADIDLGEGVVRKANIGAFEVGDIIQVSEKIDGSNASIAWNADDGILEVFSRTNLLTGADGLRGFKAYIDVKFSDDQMKMISSTYADYVIFGEWCVSHSCKYDEQWYNKWRVYDVWDRKAKTYLKQDIVKSIAESLGLEYIHSLYEGPFISWDHCRSFMQKRTYGPQQEGVVVKNQTKLNDDNIRFPKVLKIVNKEFIESHIKHEKRPIDPEQAKAEAEALKKIESVVTEARIKKLILKCVDEGYVPAHLEPKHIGLLMKRLPKDAYNDVLKEEKEIIESVGPISGKLCSRVTAKHVKEIILGK